MNQFHRPVADLVMDNLFAAHAAKYHPEIPTGFNPDNVYSQHFGNGVRSFDPIPVGVAHVNYSHLSSPYVWFQDVLGSGYA